ASSVGLALAWLRLAHAGLGPLETAVVGAAIAAATAISVYVIRLGVRADELAVIQGLSQAIARDISLAKSFGRIQELTRRLVPWEQMGFARYDAHTNEMALVADTATTGRSSFRFDANAGLTGEAVRLRRPVVAHGLQPDQVVVPGAEHPGAEVLVPLYHAGQLVGLWSVRHSDPLMYRQTDGDVLVRPAQAARRRGRHRRGPDARVGRRDGEDDREGAPRHRGRGPSPHRPGRDDRAECIGSAPAARRRRAGGEVLRDDRIHRESDQPARLERHDRSGARRRTRARLRRGGRRGAQARGGERARSPRGRQIGAGHARGSGPGRPVARARPRGPDGGRAGVLGMGRRPDSYR